MTAIYFLPYFWVYIHIVWRRKTCPMRKGSGQKAHVVYYHANLFTKSYVWPLVRTVDSNNLSNIGFDEEITQVVSITHPIWTSECIMLFVFPSLNNNKKYTNTSDLIMGWLPQFQGQLCWIPSHSLRWCSYYKNQVM